MIYLTEYETNLIGRLILASDGVVLDGCWFENGRHFGYGIDPSEVGHRDNIPVFDQVRAWLDRYFAGEKPNPRELPLGGRITPFQALVREEMLAIPYGETSTYGAIAKHIESMIGKRQSARAVGGAVGRNPLCVIVPCHRVVGANGSLTGFGGGIECKIRLLQHEQAMRDTFTIPTRGTALEGEAGASVKWLARGTAGNPPQMRCSRDKTQSLG